MKIAVFSSVKGFHLENVLPLVEKLQNINSPPDPEKKFD